MNHTVAVALKYQTHCPDCMTSVEHMIASAIRDSEVTAVRLQAVPKCDHEPALLRSARGRTHQVAAEPVAELPATEPPPTPTPMPQIDRDGFPISDTNGSDPVEVERVLFEQFQASGPLNGFDTSDLQM